VTPRSPLAGLRVLDFSRVLAGPYCTMVLADLGAEVTKVERPGAGDETRHWGPPYAGGEAAYFLSVNRGKRSCAIDLGAPAGRELALELAARADVTLENFRPGAAERLGLSYPELARRNPGLVHCSITGFGSGREPADRPGYDFVVQAESGLMAITGEPGGTPMKVGVALVDVLAGLNAAVAILAALRRRTTTGAGERIEVSLLGSALASLVNVAQNALLGDAEPGRYGNAHPSIVPYEAFRASDGWVAIAANNDGLYRRLCEALERPELAEDPRFETNRQRVEHREELVALLAEPFSRRPVDEWLAALERVGVPSGKIRGVREAFDAAAQAGDPATFVLDHPRAGRLELPKPPFSLAGSATGATAPPPLLGQHTEEVLSELGIGAERLAALLGEGIVAGPS